MVIVIRSVNVTGHTHQWGKDLHLELVADEAGLAALSEALTSSWMSDWKGADVAVKVIGAWSK